MGPNLEFAPQLMQLRLLHTPEVSRSAKTFAAAQVPATLEVSRSKRDIYENGVEQLEQLQLLPSLQRRSALIILYCIVIIFIKIK